MDFAIFDRGILRNSLQDALVSVVEIPISIVRGFPIEFTPGSVNAVLTVSNDTHRERIRARKDAIIAAATALYKARLAAKISVSFEFPNIVYATFVRVYLRRSLLSAMLEYNVTGTDANGTEVSFYPSKSPIKGDEGATAAHVMAIAVCPKQTMAAHVLTHKQAISALAEKFYMAVMAAQTTPGPTMASSPDEKEDNNNLTAKLLAVFLGLSLLFLFIVAVFYTRLRCGETKHSPGHETLGFPPALGDRSATPAWALGAGQSLLNDSNTDRTISRVRGFDAVMPASPTTDADTSMDVIDTPGAANADLPADVLLGNLQHGFTHNNSLQMPPRRDQFGAPTPYVQ